MTEDVFKNRQYKKVKNERISTASLFFAQVKVILKQQVATQWLGETTTHWSRSVWKCLHFKKSELYNSSSWPLCSSNPYWDSVTLQFLHGPNDLPQLSRRCTCLQIQATLRQQNTSQWSLMISKGLFYCIQKLP